MEGGKEVVKKHILTSTNWVEADFDASNCVYAADRVRLPQAFGEYNFEVTEFVWTGDLDLHNTVIFRKTIDKQDWNLR